MTMIREHEQARAVAGEPPAAYFFDQFILNQWDMYKDCTCEAARCEELIDGLRMSLRACGTLLLCCTAGAEGVGWERPAPLSRVWCLFETFVAIVEEVKVVVRFAPQDMAEFRRALNKGGMERVHKALDGLDARDASASVESDKAMILGDIEATVGLDVFNQRVREGLLAEYKRTATLAAFSTASSLSSSSLSRSSSFSSSRDARVLG